ncbi:MAG: DUF2513 domain-containing protein [Planctomycetota bacterium]
MKRDPDLYRKILLACETHEHGYAPSTISIDGYDKETIGYHIYLLGQAGYLEVHAYRARSHTSPNAIPKNITHAGHEFLDTIRDDEVWKTTKSIAAKTGSWALSVIASIATEIITRKAMAAIGS